MGVVLVQALVCLGCFSVVCIELSSFFRKPLSPSPAPCRKDGVGLVGSATLSVVWAENKVLLSVYRFDIFCQWEMESSAGFGLV